MQNIWESIFQFISALLIGVFDMISIIVTYGFSPQFTVIKNVFPAFDSVYSIIVALSLILAIIIFLFKIVIGMFNPHTPDYEHPFSLVINFAKFLIALWVFPVLASYLTQMANIVYWYVASEIDPSFTDSSSNSFSGLWSAFQAVMKLSFSNIANGTTNTELLSDAGIVHILSSETNPVVLFLNTIIPNAGNNIELWYKETIDPGFQTSSISQGFIGNIVSLLIVVYIWWNYFIFIIEMAERYVMFALLVFFAPLGMAPMVSRGTKDISKKYFKMFISSLLMLVFTGIFLALFQYILIYGLTGIGWGIELQNHDPTSSQTTIKVGGTLLYALILAAILKIAQRVDNYLNQLGLGTAQTGVGLGMGIAGVGRAIYSLGRQTVQSFTNPNSVLNQSISRRQQNAVNKTSGAIKNVAQSGKPSTDNLQGLNPDVLKNTAVAQQLSQAGTQGFAGQDGILMAQAVFGGQNGVIPEGATVTSATLAPFNSETQSYMGTSTVGITTADGRNQTLQIGSGNVGDSYMQGETTWGAPINAAVNGNQERADQLTQNPAKARFSVEDGCEAFMPEANANDIRDAYGLKSGEGSFGFTDCNPDNGLSLYDNAGNEIATGMTFTSGIQDVVDPDGNLVHGAQSPVIDAGSGFVVSDSQSFAGEGKLQNWSNDMTGASLQYDPASGTYQANVPDGNGRVESREMNHAEAIDFSQRYGAMDTSPSSANAVPDNYRMDRVSDGQGGYTQIQGQDVLDRVNGQMARNVENGYNYNGRSLSGMVETNVGNSINGSQIQIDPSDPKNSVHVDTNGNLGYTFGMSRPESGSEREYRQVTVSQDYSGKGNVNTTFEGRDGHSYVVDTSVQKGRSESSGNGGSGTSYTPSNGNGYTPRSNPGNNAGSGSSYTPSNGNGYTPRANPGNNGGSGSSHTPTTGSGRSSIPGSNSSRVSNANHTTINNYGSGAATGNGRSVHPSTRPYPSSGAPNKPTSGSSIPGQSNGRGSSTSSGSSNGSSSKRKTVAPIGDGNRGIHKGKK